ncbi:Protein arginine N-methyltransferase 6, partial [Oryzias melastigma]
HAAAEEKMSHAGKKRKLDKSRQDRLYFDSYADVTIHEEMIADHCPHQHLSNGHPSEQRVHSGEGCAGCRRRNRRFEHLLCSGGSQESLRRGGLLHIRAG